MSVGGWRHVSWGLEGCQLGVGGKTATDGEPFGGGEVWCGLLQQVPESQKSRLTNFVALLLLLMLMMLLRSYNLKQQPRQHIHAKATRIALMTVTMLSHA